MWSLYLCALSLSFRFNTFGLFLCWILGHHFFFRLQYTLTVYRLEIPFILGKLVSLNICSVPLFWLCSFRNLKPLCCLLCILLFCLSSILLFLQWIPSLLLSLFSWSFFASVFLFFFSVFFFYLLKYSCFSFCCTTKWINHVYKCIHCILDLPPTPWCQLSQSSQSTELSSLC